MSETRTHSDAELRGMTPSEFARDLNARNPGGGFKLAESAEHWAGYGFSTGYDLASYLATCSLAEAEYQRSGFKPSLRHTEGWTLQQLEAEADRVWAAAEREQAAERAERAERARREDPATYAPQPLRVSIAERCAGVTTYKVKPLRRLPQAEPLFG